jgi:hypothetical protein
MSGEPAKLPEKKLTDMACDSTRAGHVTAQELAQYLDGEPVRACSASQNGSTTLEGVQSPVVPPTEMPPSATATP